MEKKFYDLTNDAVFKLVFGQEQNAWILKGMLNALLGLEGRDKICELSVLNPANDAEFVGDKATYLDVKVRDELERCYNIEMQICVPKSWPKRALYYAAKLYSSQLLKGQKYWRLQKTISLSILLENLLRENGRLHNVFRFRNEDDSALLHCDLIDMHFLELQKFAKREPEELETSLEKWLYILRYGQRYRDGTIILEESLLAEKGIEEAVKAMRFANEDERSRQLIEGHEKWKRLQDTLVDEAREEGREEGRAEGREEGRAEGREEGRLEAYLAVAARLLDIHDDEEIAEITGLAVEVVAKLRADGKS